MCIMVLYFVKVPPYLVSPFDHCSMPYYIFSNNNLITVKHTTTFLEERQIMQIKYKYDAKDAKYFRPVN